VAHFRQIADKHRLPLVDLTHLFDRFDQADIGIAPWDDHPNARGHELLYKHLAQELMAEPALAQVLFPPSPESQSARSQANSVEEFSR
jgi:hypothetical protein